MRNRIQSTATPDFHLFSEIIDVRSPAEFEQDHVPGAVNCYVLDNAQRAEVGTLYKQVNPFVAKKLGASLVTRNISHWLAQHFHDKPKDYKPLVYCWRGGQRSQGMATILSSIGWEVSVIDGGYKRYRTLVRENIEDKTPQLKFVILSGLTGTAKTSLLRALEVQGEQVLDLERLANHRGSLLGSDPNKPQPSQKYFESLLAEKLQQFSVEKIVWVESESNKIGNLHCPPSLWQSMKNASRIEVDAPIEARVRYLLQEYQYFFNTPEILKNKLARLTNHHSKKIIQYWHELIDQQAWAELVHDLLSQHYDPAYQRSMAKNRIQPMNKIALGHLDTLSLQAAATALKTATTQQ